ncbi:hypothetical protein DH2020_029890 [Rehmannia glutinosa]|uniref:Uncharacterized protein n=1 Tax=Rehmannia glutinosa TaxID=99300 RepID=A0ABR0VRF0_REHGL
MAANLSFLQFSPQILQTKDSRRKLSSAVKLKFSGSCVVSCSSSNNGRGGPKDDPVKDVERLLEEKRRAELSARIASGEFTVGKSSLFWNEMVFLLPLCLFARVAAKSGFLSQLKNGLSKAGLPKEVLEFIFSFSGGPEGYVKIPEARGDIRAISSEPFFIPLYELYLTYGGVFRLTFGPKGILAEILDFVMGKGLIPADGEIWRVRRRAIVPALHQKFVAAMFSLFGEATDRLCKKLDAAASDGEDVEMESLFSRLTLDVIGKAVFNYDFDSLNVDTGIVGAVYTVLREAEDRSVAPIPFWEIPIWKDISPKLKKVNAALKLINETLDNLIAICKKMVDEEELQFHEEYMNEQDPSILHFLLASGMIKQLRDDLMTMLIAGHETSAAVLTWTFYLLAKEPSVMAKLQNEVDSVLVFVSPYLTFALSLPTLQSLRLYPQPPVLIRRSLGDDVLGKYPIKRGEDIFISVWNLHRSPIHWEEADKFNPERWPLDGPNPNETNQNFSYLPFGEDQENVLETCLLHMRFDFQMALGAPPVKMTTGATIHTTEGLKMTVTPRRRQPIIPTLDIPTVKVDSSVNVPEVETISGQKDEVSPALS